MKDDDLFDSQVDESSVTGKMDGKKVAMMLGRAIWMTVKFILYVHPLSSLPLVMPFRDRGDECKLKC